jgi:ATP-dependent helicase/nuclease subunit A
VFKVYSSSAGSGKTYTLTKEYLKLALHSNVDTYFTNILAVTFTNAAANEMKQRILEMLRRFSEWREGMDEPPMLRDVVTELYPDTLNDEGQYQEVVQLITLRSQNVFRQILHRYSDFSVMTIDKFTKKLVSSFTDELGLPFVFETKLDSDLLGDAVDRLLARIGEEGEEILTDIVEKYYREKAEEGKSWGALPAHIREASGTLLNEQSYLQMLRVANLEMKDWISIRNQMKKLVRDLERQMKQHACEAMAAIESALLIDKNFHQGNRGIYGYFSNRAVGNKLWETPNSYVVKTVEEDVWYGAKTEKSIKDAIEAIKSILLDAFNAIDDVLQKEIQRVKLYTTIDQHLYNLSLLEEIRKEFDLLLKQKNQVHISDFNKRVMEIVSKEPIPFIFERLGEKYNHILVDEFQDTSKLQFSNLLPLIENTLADGYFNLIVGDAKQSIYRFRGGDMDLILHLANHQVFELTNLLGDNEYNNERLWSVDSHLAVDHLKTNRRSFREITQFNNQFFRFVSQTQSEEFGLVGEVYDGHFEQEIPDFVKTGGHVQVEFLAMVSDEESEEAHDPIVLRSLELIEELRTTGYQWRDIAILCRKKKEATALANALKEMGYPLISDDALLLGYSRSIQFVVSFMQVLQTSDNRLARYQTAYLFHQVIRNQNPTAAEYGSLRKLSADHGLDTFLSYFATWGIELSAFEIRQLSIFELCEMLIRVFGLFDNLSENQYIFRFLDVVLQFTTKQSNHLGDFMIYWSKEKDNISITIPADTDALRITTIHKSKGLEYPVVLVPYTHWNVTPSPKLSKMWVDLETLTYEELHVAGDESKKLNSTMVSVTKNLGETLIADQYQDEKTRTLVENLNLLYVAFTRPIQRLYILAKDEKKWDSSEKVHHWLHQFIEDAAYTPKTDEELRITYVLSEAHAPCLHAHKAADNQEYVLDQIISSDKTDRLRLRRLADRIFDVDTFELRSDRLQKLRYLLTKVKSENDIAKSVQSMVKEGIWTKDEGDEVASQAIALIHNPELSPLYQTGLKIVLNKQLLLPGGRLIDIDRMVTEEDGRNVFMSFIGGGQNETSKRNLARLIQAYAEMGQDAVGVVITLENEKIEWVN